MDELADKRYEEHLKAEFGEAVTYSDEQLIEMFLVDEEVEEKKLSAKQHKKHATIPASKKYPNGRFPIPAGDKNHARQALRMLGRAKGLSSSDKSKIRARANAVLGKGKKSN